MDTATSSPSRPTQRCATAGARCANTSPEPVRVRPRAEPHPSWPAGNAQPVHHPPSPGRHGRAWPGRSCADGRRAGSHIDNTHPNRESHSDDSRSHADPERIGPSDRSRCPRSVAAGRKLGGLGTGRRDHRRRRHGVVAAPPPLHPRHSRRRSDRPARTGQTTPTCGRAQPGSAQPRRRDREGGRRPGAGSIAGRWHRPDRRRRRRSRKGRPHCSPRLRGPPRPPRARRGRHRRGNVDHTHRIRRGHPRSRGHGSRSPTTPKMP